MSQKAHIHLPI